MIYYTCPVTSQVRGPFDNKESAQSYAYAEDEINWGGGGGGYAIPREEDFFLGA